MYLLGLLSGVFISEAGLISQPSPSPPSSPPFPPEPGYNLYVITPPHPPPPLSSSYHLTVPKTYCWIEQMESYKYRKSYERECISWFMGTSDVLKVLKIARAVGEYNLRTFKTSWVTINHEMHEQVHTIFYLLYSQQNYSNALLCTRYVLHKRFNGLQ